MTHPAWLRAVASESLQNAPDKKQVTTRIEAPLAASLESMASVLGKTPTKLLSEVVEAGIHDLDRHLRINRPDLMRQKTMDEIAGELHYEFEVNGDENATVESEEPTWLTPLAAIMAARHRSASAGPEQVTEEDMADSRPEMLQS